MAALADLNTALVRCGFADAVQRVRLVNLEGLIEIDNFGDFTYDEIDVMAKRCESRRQADRVNFGIMRAKKLKALTYWVKKKRRSGDVPDVAEWTDAEMQRSITDMNLEKEKEEAADKLYPDKFVTKDWKVWAISMDNYLDSIRGTSGVPLSYITREDGLDPNDAADEHQRLVWSAPLAGPAYRVDNRKVYRIYKNRLLGTDGYTWFESVTAGDGRAASIALHDHYEGRAEVHRRAVEAEANLKTLHYKNEHVFPFQKYLTRMKQSFIDLYKDGDEVSERRQVQYMTDGVKSTHPAVIALVALIRDLYPEDFELASTHMSSQISVIFPSAKAEQQRKRPINAINAVDTQGRGRGRFERGGGGRGRGRGGGRGQNMLDGVDISDPTRQFNDEEWMILRQNGHIPWILQLRNTVNGRGGGRGRSGRGGRGRGRDPRNIGSLGRGQEGQDDQGQSSTQDEQQSGGRGGRNGTCFGRGRYVEGRGRGGR